MKKRFLLVLPILLLLVLVSCGSFTNNKNNNKKDEVVVTFNTDGGSTIDIITINKGAILNKPNDPTKDGFTFLHWTLDDVIFEFEIEIEKDITLLAVYEEIVVGLEEFTVTFDALGGSTIEPIIVTKGNSINRPNNPTKENYEFIGWFVDDVLFDFDAAINEDIILTAKWKEIVTVNTYTVTFKTGDNEFNVLVNENEKVTLPEEPTESGYKFIGWYLNGEEFNLNLEITEDITLIAMFVRVYTIHYNLLDNEENHPENLESFVIENEVFTLKEASKLGHSFLGWYADEEFTTVITEIDLSIEENYTLTPLFRTNEYDLFLDEFVTSNIENNKATYNEEVTLIINNPDNKNIESFKLNGVELKAEITNNQFIFNYNGDENEFLLSNGIVTDLTVIILFEELYLTLTDFSANYLDQEVKAYVEVFVIGEIEIGPDDHHYIVTDGTTSAFLENSDAELEYGNLVEVKAMVKNEGILVLYDNETSIMHVDILDTHDKIPYDVTEISISEFNNLELDFANLNKVFNLTGTINFDGDSVTLTFEEETLEFFYIDENLPYELNHLDGAFITATIMVFPLIEDDDFAGLIALLFNNEKLIEIN